MLPTKQHDFGADLRVVDHAVQHAVSAAYAKRKDAHWVIWFHFCLDIGVDPFLSNIPDPIRFLQVFAQRYRDGRIAPSKRQVTAKYVSDVCCSIAQTFMRVGSPDPRLAKDGSIDFRLRQLIKGWSKSDPPPARVKPAPITFVLFLSNLAHRHVAANDIGPSSAERATADMICVAFYFLLRPSVYAGTDPDHASFTLDDVHLYIGVRKLDIATAPKRDLQLATSVRLHFTTQKNQRRGDIIAHGRAPHPYCCPVKATVRLILAHRLASYYHRNQHLLLRAADVTAQLKFAARQCYRTTGIDASAITARSLRAGGAMALLSGRVDSDTIKLLGRWHSDSMMRYLHQEAQPIMKNLARTMFNEGTYNFLPTTLVPAL